MTWLSNGLDQRERESGREINTQPSTRYNTFMVLANRKKVFGRDFEFIKWTFLRHIIIINKFKLCPGPM